MRIVTGTFSHETNTFSNIPTTMEEFAKQGISHGEDIPRRFRGTNTIEAAFMDAAAEHGFELIWTVFGRAIATEVIEVDAPGITSPRLERYPYKNIRRPIYPLDNV